MKVLILTNVPSPYRVDFFNLLGESCDLTVVFEKRTSDERNASWRDYRFTHFQGIFLKGRSVGADAAFCPGVIRYVKDRSFDKIICMNVFSPTGMLAIQYMKMHRIPYWIEGDGGFAKSGRGLKEKIKRHFISGATGYFSTSLAHDEYYLTYGAEKGKIYRYPFTSISQSYVDRAREPFDKCELKKKLGINEEIVVLAVGRFIQIKGFDVLLKAAKGLPENIGIYFVGGEPTEEYLRIKRDSELQNVRFVGFKKKEELTEYYRAADIFVLPTRGDAWGLVINEAMAFSLPVITTDKCVAGLEMVHEGQNGFILPTEDAAGVHRAIRTLAGDKALREKCGAESLRIAGKYTFENMAKAHIEILEIEKKS